MDQTQINPTGQAFQLLRMLPPDADPASSSEEDLIRVGVGQPSTFRPAGLPVPVWCVVINPLGYSDSEPAFQERQLSNAFESGNNDASLTVLEGASMEALMQDLWNAALADASGHAECSNGGAYALWVLPEGRVAVGGFDNGGSDLARFEANMVAQKHGTMVSTLQDAHFDAQHFLDPERNERPEECEALRLVLAAEPSNPAPQRPRLKH